MKIITKTLTLKRDEYYAKHLQIINPILPVTMTPKEIEVLSSFMGMEGDIALDRFGTTAKKMVREKLTLSQGGLGNHMKSLKNKGFIKDGKIFPLLFPEAVEQIYNFKLINNG